jgi:uncharacterized protein YegP (UPF0339 family)
MKTVIEVYQDASSSEWRWRMKRGKNIVADSGEGYTKLGKLKTTLENIIESIQDDDITMKTPVEWETTK